MRNTLAVAALGLAALFGIAACGASVPATSRPLPSTAPADNTSVAREIAEHRRGRLPRWTTASGGPSRRPATRAPCRTRLRSAPPRSRRAGSTTRTGRSGSRQLLLPPTATATRSPTRPTWGLRCCCPPTASSEAVQLLTVDGQGLREPMVPKVAPASVTASGVRFSRHARSLVTPRPPAHLIAADLPVRCQSSLVKPS